MLPRLHHFQLLRGLPFQLQAPHLPSEWGQVQVTCQPDPGLRRTCGIKARALRPTPVPVAVWLWHSETPNTCYASGWMWPLGWVTEWPLELPVASWEQQITTPTLTWEKNSQAVITLKEPLHHLAGPQFPYT